MHENQFTIISTHIVNSAIGSIFSPAKLDDRPIQQLQNKELQQKDGVQKERKEQDDNIKSTLAMEVRMSRAKTCEISRLKTDLEQAIQDKEVQIIILVVHILHIFSVIVMPMCNGS